jgi:hypothetical protein
MTPYIHKNIMYGYSIVRQKGAVSFGVSRYPPQATRLCRKAARYAYSANQPMPPIALVLQRLSKATPATHDDAEAC